MTQPIHNPALAPPGPIAPTQPTTPVDGAAGTGNARKANAPLKGPSFAEVLAARTAAPHFTKHALDRLRQRNIKLDAQAVNRLTGGIASAAAKGSRDSVIFVDGTAFVVSVKNNTVITAVGSEHMREHVFTNIDSAVIA
jgi:flagellar operon protein